MSMSRQKQEMMVSYLTGIARKVWEAVPIVEQWELPRIMAELGRRGIRPDLNTVQGCVNSLIESGLVARVQDRYIRCPVRELPYDDTASAPAPAPAPATLSLVKAAATPLDRIGRMTARLRELAQEFKVLADEADEAALALEEQGTKLRKLRDLLRGVAE